MYEKVYGWCRCLSFEGESRKVSTPALTPIRQSGRVNTKAKTKEVKQMNRLIQAAFMAPCSGNTKLVLVGMAHGDEDGQRSYTSAEIADLIGCDQSTVSRAVSKLLEMGLVSKTEDRKYRLSIAKCNEPIAKCNEPIAKCNEHHDERKENLPPKSDSLLPPTPPIITSNTILPPSEEKKAVVLAGIEGCGETACLPATQQIDLIAGVTLNEAAEGAYRTLLSKGINADDAIRKLVAVKHDFIAKARAKEAKGMGAITNRLKYLIATWVSMAEEGPKPLIDLSRIGSITEAEKDEPRDLFDILAFLRDKTLSEAQAKFGKLDPFEAAAIRNIFDTDELPRQKFRAWRKLLEKQELNWYGETSPVAAVRRMLGIDYSIQAACTKIEAERYRLAKRRLVEYPSRIQWLERELAGKVRPQVNEPGAGYLLSFFRELDEKRRMIPVYEAVVADYETTHLGAEA